MITNTIITMYSEEKASLKEALHRAEGRLSFTTDMWSNTNLDSYMAVSVHYVLRTKRGLDYCSDLLAFQYVDGSHSGANLARHFLQILDDFEIAHKVC